MDHRVRDRVPSVGEPQRIHRATNKAIHMSCTPLRSRSDLAELRRPPAVPRRSVVRLLTRLGTWRWPPERQARRSAVGADLADRTARGHARKRQPIQTPYIPLTQRMLVRAHFAD